MLEELVQEAHECLMDREREALLMRGVTDAQIDLYRIGHSEEPLDLKGLRELADVFVFPLTNALGQVKGVQVRSVDPEVKNYTTFFVGGQEGPGEPVYFGLGAAVEAAWRSGCIWLVEGVFDLSPVQKVHPYVVSTIKAWGSQQFVRLLARLVDDVYLCWDADGPGQESCAKFARMYGNQLRFHTVRMPRPVKPNGSRVKDMGELWELWGTTKVSEFLSKVHPPLV
jgi:hypothetical protein